MNGYDKSDINKIKKTLQFVCMCSMIVIAYTQYDFNCAHYLFFLVLHFIFVFWVLKIFFLVSVDLFFIVLDFVRSFCSFIFLGAYLYIRVLTFICSVIFSCARIILNLWLVKLLNTNAQLLIGIS